MPGGLGSEVCGGGAAGGGGVSASRLLIEGDLVNAFFVKIGAGVESSATVEREVPAVVRSETSELCHVLRE